MRGSWDGEAPPLIIPAIDHPMSWGRMAVVLQLSGLRHHFRRPRRPLQVYLAASFGHCRAVWRQVSPLQVYLAASFGHCRAVWRQVSPLQVYLAASFGRCRAVWRQVSPLQVYLAASFGRCRAVALTPLLMVLLLWNMPSAIFKFNVVAAVNCSLCYLQVSPFLF